MISPAGAGPLWVRPVVRPAAPTHEDSQQPEDSPFAGVRGSRAEAPGSREEVDGLSKEDEREQQRLQERDAEVRRHEQAHAAAGGAHTGTPRFEYETGPDGRQYAVEGSVPVDSSPVRGDPEATIRKMQQIKRAALAPSHPSGADRGVAARANAQLRKATAEVAEQRLEASLSEPGSDSAGQVAQDRLGGAAAQALGAAAYGNDAAPPVGSTLSLTSCGSCGGVH